MGNISIKTNYQCCVDDRIFNEDEEQLATPRSVLEEPFKIENKVADKIETFKTLPVLPVLN